MPIYEYVCSDCKNKFELLKPMSQAGGTATCPKCGGKAGRVLSRFSSRADDSMDFPDYGGGSSCSTCSTGSCDSCSL